MSIFENISKRVSETAKAAAKKSGNIVEITRLGVSISAEEDKIKKVCTDMGRIVYEAYTGGEGIADELKELCGKIDAYEKNIEEMKQKILELKNVKECPSCGAELDIDMAFCYSCGEKQPVPQPIEAKDEEAADEEGASGEDQAEEEPDNREE
jgi:hypothetical protein